MDLMTVLIVDDDANLREGLALVLRHDYRLLFAETAEAALRLLAAEPVDIILADHMMPGMTGLEFLKLVRTRHPDTLRIMLTGHADTRLVMEAVNGGEVYRFLTKPVDRTELQLTLFLAAERLQLERQNRLLLSIISTHPDLARQLEDVQVNRRFRLVAGR